MSIQSSKNQAIKNIVILGADVNGWTAAMGLARGLQGQQANIVVIEDISKPSAEHSFIIASSHITDFHQTMGVNDNYLLTNGHAKLTCATRYKNWLSDLPDFFNGNNTFSPAFNSIALHHLTAYCQSAALSDYSYAAQIAIQNKRIPEPKQRTETFGSFNTGIALNSQEYKKFIRGAALHLGVTVVSSSLKGVELDKSSGFINKIILGNDQQLAVDLVIDNSGACSKLMQDVLKVNYQDLEGILPFNTLLTVEKSTKSTQNININDSGASNHSTIIANKYGWLEQVIIKDTQYTRQLCQSSAENDEVIKEWLLANLGLDLAEKTNITVQRIRFGQSHQFFHKNCIVIGDAAGYYGSPSISNLVLTQRAITRLLELFPSKACFSSTVNEYNRLTTKDYDEAQEYLMLHLYLASTSEESTEYPWATTKNNLSRDLQKKIALFECYGRFEDELNAMIISPVWINLLSLCCRKTANYEPLLAGFDEKEITAFLANLKQTIDGRVGQLLPI